MATITCLTCSSDITDDPHHECGTVKAFDEHWPTVRRFIANPDGTVAYETRDGRRYDGWLDHGRIRSAEVGTDA